MWMALPCCRSSARGRPEPALLRCSIFRRSYYLSHFLPALLTPRVVSTRLRDPGAGLAETGVPLGISQSLSFFIAPESP